VFPTCFFLPVIFFRFVICRLVAVRVESCGHRRCERVALVDHQVDQESVRARGHDETLEGRGVLAGPLVADVVPCNLSYYILSLIALDCLLLWTLP